MEACQNQQHFLSFIFSQKSTEWMRSNIFLWNNAAKVKTKSMTPLRKNSTFSGENELENRDVSRLSDYKKFWRFQFHDFKVAGSGLVVFQPFITPRFEIFPLLLLVDCMKAVVMYIHEFE